MEGMEEARQHDVEGEEAGESSDFGEEVELGGRRRAWRFSDEVNAALLQEVESPEGHLTRGGRGKPTPKVYQKIWTEIAEVVSSVTQEVREGNQCHKRWNDLVSSGRKKLSKNRTEQWCTGGGAPVISELTDLEERALALVGIHPRSARLAAAEPDVMPPQPKAQSQATPPRQCVDPASAGDRHSGGEEPRIVNVELHDALSTDDSEEFEEPAATSSIMSTTPMTFSAPAAMSSSTVKVAGPSTLLQGTPSVSMPVLTSWRLV
uniref:uncharacterized protein n=1 Tax=Pristiophorus japonicus TaxID=55135 RepID=UPI00398E7AE1